MSDTAPQDDYASHTIGGDEDAAGFSAVVGLVGLLDLKQLEDNLYRGVSPAESSGYVWNGMPDGRRADGRRLSHD